MTFFTYIATNKNNTVLYTGVTNNLRRRIYEHAKKTHSGFTAKYNVNKLVWYEMFASPTEAIAAEKRIKGWTREKKLTLVRNSNPDFTNLLNCHSEQSEES